MSTQLTHQGHLWKVVNSLFPCEGILNNSRKELENPETGKYFEIDIYLPKYDLCFEFQDLYHFSTVWYAQDPVHRTQTRDYVKEKTARKKEYTLVSVPYWWDGQEEPLAALIKFQRPDMLADYTTDLPISLNPPCDFKEVGIPEIGELMLASFPANSTFINSISPKNSWWMGEKYDGIRCCWNSNNRVAYSRNGLELTKIESFSRLMPNIFVDSEIWFGRGMFSHSQQMVVSSSEVALEFMRIIAFDMPVSFGVRNQPFERRYKLLSKTFSAHHPFMVLAYRMMCDNVKKVKKLIKTILTNGGEGVMLRKPNSLYEHGKSKLLIKLKASQGDREGMVLSVSEDNSVSLKMPDNTIISVPPQNVRVRVKNGDIVTITDDSSSRSNSKSGGKTIIFRIRRDITWDDVVRNYIGLLPQYRLLNKYSQGTKGELDATKKREMREQLENIARDKGLDPLLPSTWYSLSRNAVVNPNESSIFARLDQAKAIMELFPDIGLKEDMLNTNVGKRREQFITHAQACHLDPLSPQTWYSIAHKLPVKMQKTVEYYYHGKVDDALIHLFPEISFDKRLFSHKYKNRRQFFEAFAAKQGFDPLNAYAWYNISRSAFKSSKEPQYLRAYNSNDLSQELVESFPELKLEKSKFRRALWATWDTEEKRRWMFIEFARRYSFDPLLPEPWYSVDLRTLNLTFKGSYQVVAYHNGSVKQALIDLFPDITFDTTKFKSLANTSKDDWKQKRERKFFEDVALKYGFDPKIPDNWISLGYRDIIQFKEGKAILSAHKGSLGKALSSALPEIGIDLSKFRLSNYWQDKKNRRVFLENYALQNGFDALVPEGWYHVKESSFAPLQGGRSVLKSHNQSLATALADLFPEFTLDYRKYKILPKGYWTSKKHRRFLFQNYANKRKFDALIPENWYSVSANHLCAYEKKAYELLGSYNHSISAILSDAFPEIEFNCTKFL